LKLVSFCFFAGNEEMDAARAFFLPVLRPFMAGDALASTIVRFTIVFADADFTVEDFEHVRKLGATLAAKGMGASGVGGDA
jgi:hypothetical protein